VPASTPYSRHAPYAIVVAVLVGCTTPESSAQVVINEFLYRDEDTRLEFVEILNLSTVEIDLREFRLSDERRSPREITLSEVMLNPGGYAVLVRDTTAFDSRFGVPRIQPPTWPALNNGGDAVLLWADGDVVDSVSYDGSWGTVGRSMERIDPNGPSASPLSWDASQDPSGGTPGSRNSVFKLDLVAPEITEVEEWIDGSVIVYVSEPLDPTTFPLAFFRFVSGELPLASRLSSTRTQIILQPWPGTDLSSLTVEGLADAAGNRAALTSMAIARQPRKVEVVLNEILFEPVADPFDGVPDQQEFVEIRSTAGHPLALRGIFLTGRVDERGSSDTLRSEERPIRLHAGGYAVLHARGPSGSNIREAFPSLPPDSVSVLAPIPRQTLLLGNTGDTVRLHSAKGDVLDEMTYSSSWHPPERSNTRGVSLERISPWTLSNDPSSWTSSVSPEGATPGRENSVTMVRGDRNDGIISIDPSPFSPDGDGWEDFAHIDVKTGRTTSSIAVWIFDSTGRFVRSLTEGQPVGAESSFVWDGRDDQDRLVPTGIFIIYVEAVDTSAGDVRRFRKPVVVARPI
jgi:hypothetical protein